VVEIKDEDKRKKRERERESFQKRYFTIFSGRAASSNCKPTAAPKEE